MSREAKLMVVYPVYSDYHVVRLWTTSEEAAADAKKLGMFAGWPINVYHTYEGGDSPTDSGRC